MVVVTAWPNGRGERHPASSSSGPAASELKMLASSAKRRAAYGRKPPAWDIRPEWLALPLAGVQVEHWTGELQKGRITGKDPAPIPPGTQGIVCQQLPDGAARGSDFLGTESVGNLNTQFAEAVTTQRHVAISGTFARHCHDERTCGGLDDHWPTAPRAILETIAAPRHKAGEPAADGGSTQALVLSQGATAQTGRAAQDQACPADETLWGCTSSHSGRQLADFGGGQLDRGGASSQKQSPCRPPYPASGWFR